MGIVRGEILQKGTLGGGGRVGGGVLHMIPNVIHN